MPRALPPSVRQAIWKQSQTGKLTSQIALEFDVSERTVRRLIREVEKRGEEAWQANLTEGEFLALVRMLVDRQIWTIRGVRESGVPDEAYPTVTIEAEGFEALEVAMWAGEASEHPDFRSIVDVLAGLALEISGGVAR